MSESESELPERLRDAGATELEQRLLGAASREEPSRALSERMAGALGIALPIPGSALVEASKAGPTAAPPAAASSSLVPWISGALVAAVAVGGFVALRSEPTPVAPPSVATPSLAVSVEAPHVVPAASEVAPLSSAETTPSVPTASVAPPRARVATAASDVSEQIALIDAARGALASGGAERALSNARDYQARYPKGMFRPEAAVIQIEALMKLGRTAEARSMAKRFLSAHGPGPLADRVARVAGVERP